MKFEFNWPSGFIEDCFNKFACINVPDPESLLEGVHL